MKPDIRPDTGYKKGRISGPTLIAQLTFISLVGLAAVGVLLLDVCSEVGRLGKLVSTHSTLNTVTRRDSRHVLGFIKRNSLQCIEGSLLPKGQNFFNNPCPIATTVTW